MSSLNVFKVMSHWVLRHPREKMAIPDPHAKLFLLVCECSNIHLCARSLKLTFQPLSPWARGSLFTPERDKYLNYGV